MKTASKIFLLCVASVAGCGDAASIGDPPLHPVPGCEAINPAPCDVRTAPCQTRLLSLAACLRGDQPGTLPPITVMTESAYAAYMNDLVATRKPSPHIAAWESAFALIRLVQPGAFSPATTVAEAVALVTQ